MKRTFQWNTSLHKETFHNNMEMQLIKKQTGIKKCK